MKHTVVAYVKLLVFTPFILLLLGQNTAFSQPDIPLFKDIPTGSVLMEITVTPDMIKKDYYYRLYYVTNGRFPIWTAFYPKDRMNYTLSYSPGNTYQPAYNKFSIVNRWQTLKKPGKYIMALMSRNLPIPLQQLIQTIQVSSNTRKALEDNRTLIVNDSVGVAPEKGTRDFKIRYELNDTSNMLHEIMKNGKKDELITSNKVKNVERGTRGFDWDSKDAKSDCWYHSEVRAESVYDPAKWDKAISRDFQKLK